MAIILRKPALQELVNTPVWLLYVAAVVLAFFLITGTVLLAGAS